ncbi:hypothetical protein [Micromonospora sp. KC207]|uniref:hypothetical protein n=1 Tax=Micromonospora sp. KC207 TaxID=2530377 RepID=UPI001404E72F|nr:hypothetical protein [Micromonospora sp. KC207]
MDLHPRPGVVGQREQQMHDIAAVAGGWFTRRDVVAHASGDLLAYCTAALVP